MALAARQPAKRVNVAFDGEEDVLYVSLGEPVPSHVDEGEGGLHFRWANADEHPSDVTAIDFRRNWLYDRTRFYK